MGAVLTLEPMEVIRVDEPRPVQAGEMSAPSEGDPRKVEFREIDTEDEAEVERYLNALRNVLAKLTAQERLLGKVDDEGDIVWSGSPRAMYELMRSRGRPEATDE